jgi:hypothetical protein
VLTVDVTFRDLADTDCAAVLPAQRWFRLRTGYQRWTIR